jgi:hypothetical protein
MGGLHPLEKNRRALKRESLSWIREHPFATNHDVPDRLVMQWSYRADDPFEPSSFYLGIFSFGYLQRQLLESSRPVGEKHSIPADRLLELFHLWQLKLAITTVHRETDLKVSPNPLFSFPPDEELSYWRAT